MSNRAEIGYWKLFSGGRDGGVHLDASVSTAISTGLEVALIDVLSPVIFTTLAGADIYGAAIDYLTANGLTGLLRQEGFLFAGHGRWFTDVAISTGQCSLISKCTD